MNSIEEVLGKYSNEWMKLPEVAGTAIGLHKNNPCILIFVIKKSSSIEKRIPPQIEGFPVIIEETGGFNAL